MELFLNFLWVLIAVFGFSVWRVCWAPERSGRRNPLQEWTAFVAAAVFLFFAVSLTDDLHSNLVLFEECASGRRNAIILPGGHASPQGAGHTSASSVAVLPGLVLWRQSDSFGHVTFLSYSPGVFLKCGLRSGRAPPLSLL